MPLTSARCRCGALHDSCGDHLAACPSPAQAFFEQGASMEVIATSLPLWGGAKLAVCFRVIAAGQAHKAWKPYCRSCPAHCKACSITHVNCAGPTVAGSLSWSVEAATFLRLLATCRARFAPQHSASLTRCRHLGFYATVVCVPRLRSPALFRSQPAIRALHWHVQRPRELPPLSDVLAESTSQPLLASRVV